MQMDRHPLTQITFPEWFKPGKELAAKIADFNKAAEALRADKVKVATQAEAVAAADPVEVSPDDFAAVRRNRIATLQNEIKVRRELPALVAAIQESARALWQPARDAAGKQKADLTKKLEALGFDAPEGFVCSHPELAKALAHVKTIQSYPNTIHSRIGENAESMRVREEELRTMLKQV